MHGQSARRSHAKRQLGFPVFSWNLVAMNMPRTSSISGQVQMATVPSIGALAAQPLRFTPAIPGQLQSDLGPMNGVQYRPALPSDFGRTQLPTGTNTLTYDRSSFETLDRMSKWSKLEGFRLAHSISHLNLIVIHCGVLKKLKHSLLQKSFLQKRNNQRNWADLIGCLLCGGF